MIKIAICDDEIVHIDIIRDYITYALDYLQEEYRIFTFMSADKLINHPLEYDILFLDLRLGDGKDGIEVGITLREMGYEQVIIIVTSLEYRSRDGYFTKALRFIEKPVHQVEITEAIKAAIYELKNSGDRIAIQFNGTINYIPYNSILWAETYYNKRTVHTINAEYETNERWQSLTARLPSYRFFNANKSCCINLSNVRSAEKSQVIMTNGKEIVLGRGKKKEFDKAFHAYVGGLKSDRIHANL